MTLKEEETVKKRRLSVTAKGQGRRCWESGTQAARTHNINEWQTSEISEEEEQGHGWQTDETSEKERQEHIRSQHREDSHWKRSADTTNVTKKKTKQNGQDKESGESEGKTENDVRNEDPKEEEERR